MALLERSTVVSRVAHVVETGRGRVEGFVEAHERPEMVQVFKRDYDITDPSAGPGDIDLLRPALEKLGPDYGCRVHVLPKVFPTDGPLEERLHKRRGYIAIEPNRGMMKGAFMRALYGFEQALYDPDKLKSMQEDAQKRGMTVESFHSIISELRGNMPTALGHVKDSRNDAVGVPADLKLR